MKHSHIIKELQLLENKKKELIRDIDERIDFYKGKLNSIKERAIDKYFSVSKDSLFKYSFKECYVAHIHFEPKTLGKSNRLLLVKWSVMPNKTVIINHFEIMTVKSKAYNTNTYMDISKFKSKLSSLLSDVPYTNDEIRLSKLNCRVDEIAISYDYQKKIGESKLRIWRNGFRLIILLFKLVSS